MNLPIDIKASLRRNVALSHFCTMQVGGAAKYFSEPTREEELLELLDFARHESLPYQIIGKGSNVIFPDEGFPGLVITLIRFEQNLLIADRKTNLLTASSGIHLYRLVLAAREAGLGGAEFLCNVPGSVGGALVMNAGFSRSADQKNEIGNLVEEITVLNEQGKKEKLERKDLHFSYRRSNLAGKIVLSGTLKLYPKSPEEIQKEIRANFDYRNDKQDLKHPSSGSIFKNPDAPHPSAGRLIEQVGLKGKRVGGAMISNKHANYIINAGGAKSSDIVQLIREVQKAVFDATKIHLEPEVRIIEIP